MSNEAVRKVFNDYYEANNKPQLKVIAKKMNIDESYFIKWKNGQRDMSSEYLVKVINFIDEYDYRKQS